NRYFSLVCAASPGLEIRHDTNSKSQSKDFTVFALTHEDRDIKVRVDASGSKTQAIFDDVFSKLVEAAQPIPGFKRLKGGNTPVSLKISSLTFLDRPKLIKHSIKKIINSTTAECVAKEGLKVSKDLRVEQSYEELEQIFVPGKEFGFDAAIQLQENKKMQI
ncbi:uncharacterized protein LOC109838834, partial [Asparagus officinalis]|uniref:uncharacterized protein LOC109838834 n=1 Tax=Asparagus officinalis TaxID=4686 RepID=UPI00098E51FD